MINSIYCKTEIYAAMVIKLNWEDLNQCWFVIMNDMPQFFVAISYNLLGVMNGEKIN